MVWYWQPLTGLLLIQYTSWLEVTENQQTAAETATPPKGQFCQAVSAATIENLSIRAPAILGYPRLI